MQQGSTRPLAVKYITVQGRRQSDQGEPSSARLKLRPGSEAAPEAEKVRPSEAASAIASSMNPASSVERRS
jgi:hypothetical protein